MTFDRVRYSTIGHTGLALCGPIADAALERLFDRAALADGASVLDVGCGKGEMLVRLAERAAIRGTGVDPNAAFIAEARARAAERGVAARVTFVESAMERFTPDPAGYDAALCVGATHAFGDLAATCAALARLVRPGGHVLAGEGYWRRPPEPGYLEVLRASATDHGTHEQNAACGAAAGLELVEAHEADADVWDEYEGAYAQNLVDWCAAHPDDPDAPAFMDRITAWRDAYLRWGRDTLGFGLYLWRRP